MATTAQASRDHTLDDFLGELQPRLVQVLNRFRIPPGDAEDLVQDTMVLFLERRREIEDPELWIVATLRNRCLMFWRARRQLVFEAIDREILESMQDSSPSAADRCEVEQGVRVAVSRVRGRCQNLLRVRYTLDCTPAETAQRLGYKPSGVHKLLERCLAELTQQLAACGFGEIDRDVAADR